MVGALHDTLEPLAVMDTKYVPNLMSQGLPKEQKETDQSFKKKQE